MDRSGLQWGEHKDMEQLFQLGVAAGFVDLLLAREYWKFLPGDVPYYAISFNESRVCQSPRYQG
jgi:hypothetical protein